MEVSDLILADYAASNEGGKFTLVGAGFSRISSPKLPCVHPLMYLLVRLKVTKQDVGRNKIEVRIVGNSGFVFRAEGDMEVKPEHNEEQHLPIPFRMVGATFDHAGDYNVEVVVNGEIKQSQVLKIVLLTPQAV